MKKHVLNTIRSLVAALALGSPLVYAGPDLAPLIVWVNEAVVATNTYSYKNYLQDQKQIAKYFTADAWIAYNKALNTSQLPEAVQKNLYYVSAIPTEPPVITPIDATHWKAVTNLLVVYQNPQYQQHQTLKVTVNFGVAPSGQGVRGYSITNLQAVTAKPPCQCPIDEEMAPPPNVGNATK
ncbi:DotI/IcmL family type IV secretion protein [Legionella lytica]|uniref:DotI/IcmL family type IV secretion protein n=1 Tax=Legionella lytica TaxID=96232 RepID=A0ABY4Y7D7_9GAMM|nr:DotI/IcmL family type IV secretion protein [Legionella lytica]USQ13558.1 DotI/IcmL family type IV secretion protein [Legionella lytica]